MGNEIRDQTHFAYTFIARGDNDLAYRVVAAQCRFDLADLNSKAANLHLIVFSSETYQAVLIEHAADVTCGIDAVLAAIRVAPEGLASKVWILPVAFGEVSALHGYFAHIARFDWQPAFIEDQDLHIFDWPADRYSWATYFRRLI